MNSPLVFLPPLCPVDPPLINKHPDDKLNAVPGSTVKFTVIATGGGDLTYQWQWNGADLDPPPEGVSSETTNTLTIASVRETHQGVYSCVVSNASRSSTTSNPAQLAVRKFLCLVFLLQMFCVLPEM